MHYLSTAYQPGTSDATWEIPVALLETEYSYSRVVGYSDVSSDWECANDIAVGTYGALDAMVALILMPN